jgi:hypothetical protein
LITETAIKQELEKIESSLINSSLTREQYLELYAVQQALTWVLDSELAAAPYDVVMSGKVQPLMVDTLAN